MALIGNVLATSPQCVNVNSLLITHSTPNTFVRTADQSWLDLNIVLVEKFIRRANLQNSKQSDYIVKE